MPVKKPKFRRFGISAGTKVQQSNLRKLAKRMADDPKVIVPECVSQCSSCAFDKTLVKLRKIHSMRKNDKALVKLASSGKQLERGYASMLILANETTPIMFATAGLPSGDVSYTNRGKMNKETLIGFQHFDDPVLRLLAYSEIALKRRIHLYSTEKKILCSGKQASYPEELLREIIRNTDYTLRKAGGTYQCEHMSQHEGQSLRIDIKSLGISLEICKQCTSRKVNIYNELIERVLARHPEKDFEIFLAHDLKCISGDNCSLDSMGINTSQLIGRYRSGSLSDRELLEEHSILTRETLEGLGKTIFVLGNNCFEDDMDAFISALEPSEIEEVALKRMLKAAHEPIVLDTGTPNAVLSLFWDKIGASAIYAVIGDKELAAKIYKETKDSGKPPAQILRDAKIQAQSKNVLDSLPELKLGTLGKHADEIARTYKAMGKAETIRLIDRSAKGTKMKSINCGFLKSMNALKGKEWQFTKEELDYGEYLKDFAKALLDSEPSEYREKLQNLLTASGSGETIST